MHMVFEVQDLASASPATVSRYVFDWIPSCGCLLIVYMFVL